MTNRWQDAWFENRTLVEITEHLVHVCRAYEKEKATATPDAAMQKARADIMFGAAYSIWKVIEDDFPPKPAPEEPEETARSVN